MNDEFHDYELAGAKAFLSSRFFNNLIALPLINDVFGT